MLLPSNLCTAMLALPLFCFVCVAPLSIANENLEPILKLVLELDDPSFQRDLLKGMREGLAGKRNLTPPPSWEKVSKKLGESPDLALREEVRLLGLTFGDELSLKTLKKKALDEKVPVEERKRALKTLVEKKAKGLAEDLKKLLDDDSLRIDALRGLAVYATPDVPGQVLARYPKMNSKEKREAIQLLVSRTAFADVLLAAMSDGKVRPSDVPVFAARQIQGFGGRERQNLLRKTWGELRSTSGNKQALYTRYKKLLTPNNLEQADLSKGRLLYQKTCGACHKLYGIGGQIGPDLTGTDRATLDYLLENVLEPNAAIGKDYQLSVITTKDGRALSGVISAENASSLVLRTLTEEVTISIEDIASRKVLPVSMMPEGIFQALPDPDARDLAAYLMGNRQVPLPKE